ncbi:MAG: 50S ribosomal protein L4, partial [Candidatus Kerfeldbacteria bacterium CG08_land_8_20_14_0_20_42_7]
HAKINAGLLQEVIVSFLADRREANAHTKYRSEVRGGGKKPWRQKGTGRARHGSTRSPIWRGGGVTFGPRNTRNYTKKINVKAKRRAVCMALTEKLENKKIVVIDALSMKEPKTKELLVVMKNLPKLRNAILMLDANHKIAVQASKNVKGIAVMAPRSINAYDVLSHDGLIITKAAVKQLEQHLTSKKA